MFYFLLLCHVLLVACCRRASTVCIAVPQASRRRASTVFSNTASTAQHSAISPQISPHKASKQVRADPSATTQASRQSCREPAHVVHAFIQHAGFSKRTKKLKSVPPTKNYNFSLSAVVTHEGFICLSFDLNKIQHCSFSPSFFYVCRTCMRRPSCYPGAWSSWHLQVVSLHLKLWTSLSASSFAFCYSSL